jgi:7-cyano-7-deazaguanine synthase
MTQIETVVILSGGQDSTTCLYWALHHFSGPEHIAAVTFDYGQRHKAEVSAAEIICEGADVELHEVIELGPNLLSDSPLTEMDAELETYSSYSEMDKIIGDRVEKTFVPMRNAVFLTFAANRAVALGANSLVTGVCQMDNANYPDCREVFIRSMETTINRALGNPVTGENAFIIHTPLMWKSKADTVRLARTLPGCWDALAYSHTAYDGSYPPTSRDHASVLRAQGFLEAGEPDPLVVRAWQEGLMDLPATSNYVALQRQALGGGG